MGRLKRTPPMTLTIARLIVRNSAAYPAAKVREAAVFILGSLSATAEDVHDASHALIG
jgi:hypothetical protein